MRLIVSPSRQSATLGSVATRYPQAATLLGTVLALGGQAGITAFHLGLGPGLPERLASHPLQAWLVIVGVAVLFSTRRGNDERRLAVGVA